MSAQYSARRLREAFKQEYSVVQQQHLLLSLHREMSSKATCQLAREARGEATREINPFNLQEVEAGSGNVGVTITSAGQQF